MPIVRNIVFPAGNFSPLMLLTSRTRNTFSTYFSNPIFGRRLVKYHINLKMGQTQERAGVLRPIRLIEPKPYTRPQKLCI